MVCAATETEMEGPVEGGSAEVERKKRRGKETKGKERPNELRPPKQKKEVTGAEEAEDVGMKEADRFSPYEDLSEYEKEGRTNG